MKCQRRSDKEDRNKTSSLEPKKSSSKIKTENKANEETKSKPVFSGQGTVLEAKSKPILSGQGTTIPSITIPSTTTADDEEAVDKDVEKELQAMDGYHGYLPREDLKDLLKDLGDYLIRVSETEAEDGKDANKLKQIILSVKAEKAGTKSSQLTPASTPIEDKDDMVRNVIIRKKRGLGFFVTPKKAFMSVRDVIEFYKTKPGRLCGVQFQLKTPIPLQKWEFKHADVKLCGKELGKGEFGVVQLGELKTKKGFPVPVAIKSTKGEVELTKAKIKELMREARLVRFFKNPNVVRTYGVAVDEQPLFILLEMVDGGALNKYLAQNKEKITAEDRLSMTLGAARGLAYLHKMDMVHCDVAARNCLVTTYHMVKIADFGLSTTLKAGDVHSKADQKLKLPVKWLSPETLTNLSYSHKSDVYSFGVLTFEIYTGMEPYSNIQNKEAKEKILMGKTLDIPKPLPPQLQSFFKERVFSKSQNSRPTMTEVIIALVSGGAKDIEQPKKK